MSTATTPAKPAAPKDPLKVLTPEFRVSFPALFEPVAQNKDDPTSPKKYSVTMLFAKSTDLSALKAAATAAAKARWGDKTPKGLRTPFRDGEEKELDGYAGCIFVKATSKERPGVVDAACRKIEDGDERVYAGCYARATLRAFAYDQNGNRGVSFGLQNVQILRDGEQFSGKRKAEDDFDAVAQDPSPAGEAVVVTEDDFDAGPAF